MIFLSTLTVLEEYRKDRIIEHKQNQFIDAISTSEHVIYDGSIFTEYPVIFKEIEESDILVAFVDDYWLSSTWKAVELWYAAGASPEKDGQYISKPLKCYLHSEGIANPNISALLKRKNVNTFDGTYKHLECQCQDT